MPDLPHHPRPGTHFFRAFWIIVRERLRCG
jgi:hypothetical protein